MESIKQEIGEELIEEEEQQKKIEYDENNLIKTVDDSWIRLEDKEKLIKYVKESTLISHPWADDTLYECIVMKRYYSIIENMDKSQYELEIKNPLKSVLTILN